MWQEKNYNRISKSWQTTIPAGQSYERKADAVNYTKENTTSYMGMDTDTRDSKLHLRHARMETISINLSSSKPDMRKSTMQQATPG
jgi:hypothetical protein